VRAQNKTMTAQDLQLGAEWAAAHMRGVQRLLGPDATHAAACASVAAAFSQVAGATGDDEAETEAEKWLVGVDRSQHAQNRCVEEEGEGGCSDSRG
jgi:hypothetical protein